ncbi:MAG: ATP-grasp domain-containing protein [Myxococcales bacterium]|nr:ATP-grasp domain-containing protein [Myxococcales bacterium]
MSRRVMRVLVMMHRELLPPESLVGLSDKEIEPFKTEYDVVTALGHLDHEVHQIGLHDELRPLRLALQEVRPHVVFNLLEEFHGESVYDHHVVSYLELSRQAYTGCNPRGLVLARDKALSKKILHYHRIRVPGFATAPRGRRFRRPSRLPFPLIVKSLIEEGSVGIAEASVVHNDDKLLERIEFVHDHVGTDAIVEQFIDGRELYSSILGNHQLRVFRPWELIIGKLRPGAPLIATSRTKWDLDYQERRGVTLKSARVGDELLEEIARTTKRIYKVLGMSGYARIDFRLDPQGRLYFLEANPNPDVARGGELMCATEEGGLSYEETIQKILTLGRRQAQRRRRG